MPPGRQPSEFTLNLREHEALVGEGTVDNGELFESLGKLETSGLRLVGEGKKDAHQFNLAMQKVFHKLVDLEVVPPLSEDQKALAAGKVATYGAAIEASKPTKKAPAQKTDTNKIKTSSRK